MTLNTKSAFRLPSLANVKAQARRLRDDLSASQTPMTHSQSLEMIAHQFGYRDWNTLHAVIGNRPPPPPLAVGDRVCGTYLGQSVKGEIIGLQMQMGERFRITLELDDPVDVVKFESFSAFRRRINATINRTGETVEKTSDGRPQLVLSI